MVSMCSGEHCVHGEHGEHTVKGEYCEHGEHVIR
jgi:hypothetical protein